MKRRGGADILTFLVDLKLETFKYNHELLKATRKSKNISMLSMANDLCLAERQIRSIEDNSLGSFPSSSIKFVSIKKYITALGLEYQDVIEDFAKVAECFTPHKEFMFNPLHSKQGSDLTTEQSFFDEVKEEFKALPKAKKLQYLRNVVIVCLSVFGLYECFFNEAIILFIDEYYSIIVSCISDIPNKISQLPTLLMKYGK